MTGGIEARMSNTEFRIGEYVVYGTSGVCKIENITLTSLSSAIPPRQYYILTQVKSASTIYVPCEGPSEKRRMRYLLSKDGIDRLLSSVKDKTMEWNSDRKARNTLFHDILSAGVSEEYLLMIRCIYAQKEYLESNKKKLSNTDSDILFTAQTLLEDEFSFVLGISCQEVGKYIKDSLGIGNVSLY